MADLTSPPQLPDYDFDRELGRGGMGTVYLYRHAITQRPEVVKLLSPDVLAKPGNRGRFEREIRAAFKLSHPNIVAAYSTHRVGNALAFCMEYVDGDDLMRVVQRDGPLTPGEACAYAVQALHGLQHAHEHGMVHRDIKPGNLMRTVVNGRSVVKVVDFGLAKLGGDRETAPETGLTQYGQVLGTPDFIAPEQIRDTAGADIRADIYSLGCTLYFMLAGRPPFKGESLYDLFEMHIHAEAPGIDRVVPGLPPGLAAVVARMMAKDPAARPQTPQEAAELLMPFAQFGTHSSPSLALPPDAPAQSTAAVSASSTPPQSATRRQAPADAFVSLSPTDLDQPISTRYRPVRLAPTQDETRRGWLVPVMVGAFVLAGVVALVWVLSWPPRIETPPSDTPSTPLQKPQPGNLKPDPKPPDKPPIPETPVKPIAPEWYTTLFGDAAAVPKQTVWPEGSGWQLRDGVFTAEDAPAERLALFDGPPAGDFDLTAEVRVSGGAGLLVRGDRRAADGQPTGYLIGLGKSNPDSTAFHCGAIHRWGPKNGWSRMLAAGEPAWASPDRPLKLTVSARGDRVNIQIDAQKPVTVRDIDGYAGGLLGLATQPGGRVDVTKLSVTPVAPPPNQLAAPADGFTPLTTYDRLGGWEVEGDDRYWEMAGPVLFCRQVGENSNTSGHLLSAAVYANFELRFDFLLKPKATALIDLRAVKDEKASFLRNGVLTPQFFHPCLRLAVGADATSPRLGSLERWFGNRAIWPPARGQAVLNPLAADAWHEAQVRVEGSDITVVLDNIPVKYDKFVPNPKLTDPAFTAGHERKDGRIGFCPVVGETHFRNVRVKDLKPAATFSPWPGRSHGRPTDLPPGRSHRPTGA